MPPSRLLPTIRVAALPLLVVGWLGCGLLALLGSRAEPPPPPQVPAAECSGSVGAEPAPAATAVLARPGEAVPVARTVGGTPSATFVADVELSGRCLDADTGAPLGASLAWTDGTSLGEVAADGSFELRVPAAAEARWLRFAAPGRADLDVLVDAGRTGRLPLGELRLRAGLELAITLVDRDGAAVPAQTFSLLRTASGNEAAAGRPRTTCLLCTDAAGHAVARGLAPGVWRVAFDEPLLQVVEPAAELLLDAETTRHQLRVVVATPDRAALLQGVVVGAEGKGVAGIEVVAVDDRGVPLAVATTTAAGAFVLQPPGTDAVRLWVPEAAGYEVLGPLGPFARGGPAPMLQLVGGRDVLVEVVDAATGAPCVPTAFECAVELADGRVRREELAARSVGDGAYAVSGVLQRDAVLRVVAGTEYLPWQGVVAASTAAPVRIVLQRSGELLVTVTDATGHGLAGSEVSCEPVGSVLASAPVVGVTDANGVVRLGLPWAAAACRVHVAGPEHLVADEAGVPGVPLHIVVDRGGGLAGRIVPGDVLAALRQHAAGAERLGLGPRLELVPVQGEGNPRLVPLAADGTFLARALPIGRWRVRFLANVLPTDTAPGTVAWPLGECQVTAAEPPPVEFDIAGLRPATLCATVLLDGVPLPEANVRLLRCGDGDDPALWCTPRRTDAHGAVEFRGLQPGTYALALVGGEPPSPAVGTVTVAPGATVRHQFHVVP